MKRKGVWWLLEMNVDMRKEKNQSALEEEAETLVMLKEERPLVCVVCMLMICLSLVLQNSWRSSRRR